MNFEWAYIPILDRDKCLVCLLINEKAFPITVYVRSGLASAFSRICIPFMLFNEMVYLGGCNCYFCRRSLNMFFYGQLSWQLMGAGIG